MDLSAGEEVAKAGPLYSNIKSDDVCVELGRSIKIFNVKDQMSNALYLRHILSSLLMIEPAIVLNGSISVILRSLYANMCQNPRPWIQRRRRHRCPFS